MQIRRKKLREDYKVHKNTQYRQFELVAKIIKRPFNHWHAHAVFLPVGKAGASG